MAETSNVTNLQVVREAFSTTYVTRKCTYEIRVNAFTQSRVRTVRLLLGLNFFIGFIYALIYAFFVAVWLSVRDFYDTTHTPVLLLNKLFIIWREISKSSRLSRKPIEKQFFLNGMKRKIF